MNTQYNEHNNQKDKNKNNAKQHFTMIATRRRGQWQELNLTTTMARTSTTGTASRATTTTTDIRLTETTTGTRTRQQSYK